MSLQYTMTLEGSTPRRRVQLFGLLTPFQTYPWMLGVGIAVGAFLGLRKKG